MKKRIDRFDISIDGKVKNSVYSYQIAKIIYDEYRKVFTNSEIILEEKKELIPIEKIMIM